LTTPDPSPPLERRTSVASTALETRAVGQGPGVLVGHAAVFDEWTTLYQGESYTWREVVRPGAFRDAIAEAQDVRGLWNHEPNNVLGRTKSGTCRIAEDSRGLAVEIDLPDTQLGRDLAVLMARGDVTQMSFAFRVRKGGEKVTVRQENGLVTEERELTALDLYDVSPVCYPAYQGTDCALRAEGERRERSRRRRPDVLRAMRLRLSSS
jgi:uncharacterized protein